MATTPAIVNPVRAGHPDAGYLIAWRLVIAGLAWWGLLAALHGDITQLRYFSQRHALTVALTATASVLGCAVVSRGWRRALAWCRGASTTYAIVSPDPPVASPTGVAGLTLGPAPRVSRSAGRSLPQPVQVVAAGSLVGVDPGGWDDLGVAVGGDPDLPVALVDQGVVMAAQAGAVDQAGGSAVDPMQRCGGSRTSGRAGRSRGTRIRRRAGRRPGGCRWARCGWRGRCPTVRRSSRARPG